MKIVISTGSKLKIEAYFSAQWVLCTKLLKCHATKSLPAQCKTFFNVVCIFMQLTFNRMYQTILSFII